MSTSIPDVSTLGFAKASLYNTHRPSYPLEAVDSLLSNLHVAGLKEAKIVDLAAGTGKFTELLATRAEDYDITAIEPHDEMRTELEGKRLGNVVVKKGEATKMPVESQSVDAVIVAQAWHWFANEEALDEIYRVLIPGGSIGLIWNVEDYNAPKSWIPTTRWEANLKDIVWASGSENPRLRHEQWKQVFEKQLESNPLSINTADPRFSLPLGEEFHRWTHWLSRDDIWNRYSTLSQFAALDDHALEITKQKVFESLEGSDVERDDDGKIALHGRTMSAWSTAVPGAPLKSGG